MLRMYNYILHTKKDAQVSGTHFWSFLLEARVWP